jgi:Holliday junction resolvase
MRARYQADGNQAAIVAALRAAGCSVSLIQGANSTAGVPDLLVGFRGETFLLEVKRPKAKGQQAGRLSPAQVKWALEWVGGLVRDIRTVEEALRAVGLAA